MLGSYSPINLLVRNRTIIATKRTEKYIAVNNLVWDISCVKRNTRMGKRVKYKDNQNN